MALLSDMTKPGDLEVIRDTIRDRNIWCITYVNCNANYCLECRCSIRRPFISLTLYLSYLYIFQE